MSEQNTIVALGLVDVDSLRPIGKFSFFFSPGEFPLFLSRRRKLLSSFLIYHSSVAQRNESEQHTIQLSLSLVWMNIDKLWSAKTFLLLHPDLLFRRSINDDQRLIIHQVKSTCWPIRIRRQRLNKRRSAVNWPFRTPLQERVPVDIRQVISIE